MKRHIFLLLIFSSPFLGLSQSCPKKFYKIKVSEDGNLIPVYSTYQGKSVVVPTGVSADSSLRIAEEKGDMERLNEQARKNRANTAYWNFGRWFANGYTLYLYP